MQTVSIEYAVSVRDQANRWEALNPGLRQELDRVNAELFARSIRNNFYTSLSESLRRFGSLTERQTAALKKSLAEGLDRAAQRKAAAPVITSPIPNTKNRVRVTGTVKSVKWQDNDFGGGLKMLVQSDEGWRVWGTVPAALGDVEVGNRIEFVAGITPKDAEFGFFSRPAQARRLDSAPVTEVERAPEPAAPVVPTVVTPLAPAPATKLAGIIAQLQAKA